MTDQSTSSAEKRAELALRQAERAHDQSHELRVKFIDAATLDTRAAITVLLGINGGSAAALLAFAGNLIGKPPHAVELISNLQWFVYGVVSSAALAISAYLANACYGAAHTSRKNVWTHPYVTSTRATVWWLAFAYLFHAIGLMAAAGGVYFFVRGMRNIEKGIGVLLS